jgi:hypothetical protein
MEDATNEHSVTWRLVTVEEWKPMTVYNVRHLHSLHFNDVMNVKVLDVLGLNSNCDYTQNVTLKQIVELVAAALEKKEERTQQTQLQTKETKETKDSEQTQRGQDEEEEESVDLLKDWRASEEPCAKKQKHN